LDVSGGVAQRRSEVVDDHGPYVDSERRELRVHDIGKLALSVVTGLQRHPRHNGPTRPLFHARARAVRAAVYRLLERQEAVDRSARRRSPRPVARPGRPP
jgi:hypothetical protein